MTRQYPPTGPLWMSRDQARLVAVRLLGAKLQRRSIPDAEPR